MSVSTGHKYIVEHAKEITAKYFELGTKTAAANFFSISMGGVDRALYITGHSDLCSKWFLENVVKVKAPEKLNAPSFDEMFNFLLDVMGKAEKTPGLEEKVRILEIKIAEKSDQIHKLAGDAEKMKNLRQQWELRTSGSEVTHGD